MGQHFFLVGVLGFFFFGGGGGVIKNIYGLHAARSRINCLSHKKYSVERILSIFYHQYEGI